MASIGSKREWEVSEIEECKGVCVHGIPLNVSPTKESKTTKGVKYFDMLFTDGKKCAWVVSFDVSHRPLLKKAEEEQTAVVLFNSNVKNSSYSSEAEVHLHKRSKVMESPRKMCVGNFAPSVKKSVKVADIGSLTVKEEIEVTCKVVEVKDVSIVKKSDGKELKKQDVMIGDETGMCRLVLWEEDVQGLEEGKSYCFTDLGVRTHGGIIDLSFTTKSAKVAVENLQEVNKEFVQREDSDGIGQSVAGEISVVISSAEYLSCKICHSKVVASEDGVVAECSKCGAVMKVVGCNKTKSARFVVRDASGREVILSAFEPILELHYKECAGCCGRSTGSE